jgi:hypothetical protein
VRAKTTTKSKGYLPLIFKVRLKPRAELVFMNYHLVRKNHQLLLLEYFESVAVIKDEKELDNFA